MQRRERVFPRLVLAFAAACFAAGCSQSTLEPLPLQISLTPAHVTAAPGDSITLIATMQGGSLLGMIVDYGDKATDQFPAGGARTARIVFRHAYLASGTFVIRASVTDASAGQAEAVTEAIIK
jgi:hypothetical protein